MARGPRIGQEFPLVAVLKKRGKLFEAESAFGRDEPSVLVGRKSLAGARSGELVELRPAGRGRGEVVRRLGKADSLPAIMEGVLTYYRVPRGFSRKALAEAEAGAELASLVDPDRRDLTDLETFTVDPDEARDFDDAISLVDGPGPGETTLYVHIADVSYFVANGSALDRAAANKACSVYLPVAVEPMLPPVLSSEVCSLRPDVARKCVTVEMIFPSRENPAEPPVHKQPRFYRSTIRSRRRLTYNEVDDLFEGIAGLGNPELEALLGRCRQFAADLRDARHARGALNIQTFEPEFRLDETGEVVGVRPRPESESHALIEEFMIAANEAVAEYLQSRQRDCIYRVHEQPDPAAVDALFDMLEDLGIPTPPFSLKTGTPAKAGKAIRELLASLPRVLTQQQQSRSAFGEIVLRSLKQAIYLEDNLGHFGLASPAYLHFTSPIRRYPDLMVHRALLSELRIEQFSCSRTELAEIALTSSENERRAAMVERTGDDVVLAFLLDRLLFEEGWDSIFEGEIVSVIPSGVFVRFECCYEGYVPARVLWGDYFAISEKGGSLIGRRHGRTYRLGDRMSVRVVRIDKLRGKVELEPAR
jgi:ribonuclease R